MQRKPGAEQNYNHATFLKNPFEYPWGSMNAARVEDSAIEWIHELKQLDFKDLGQGRCRIVAANDYGAREIDFGDDPSWAPIKVKFFLRRNRPLPKRPLTAKDVLDWDHFATTETEWSKDDAGRIYPKLITMAVESSNISGTAEMKFSHWKFGTDVDKALADPKNFTRENLATVDFAELRNIAEGRSNEDNEKHRP